MARKKKAPNTIDKEEVEKFRVLLAALFERFEKEADEYEGESYGANVPHKFKHFIDWVIRGYICIW
jgi:hypothetical protein